MFEWDSVKADANYRKHGVGFVAATQVFEDPLAIEDLDVSADYGEERFLILGRAGDRLLTVVYTERPDRIRIISAREATI
jgi:uncharacterized protein